MSDFTAIFFDGNSYVGWISHKYELSKIYEAYEGEMTPDEILDKAVNVPGSDTSFGFRREHTGNTTLRMHLRNMKINNLIKE